jgi:hypothetical protein
VKQNHTPKWVIGLRGWSLVDANSPIKKEVLSELKLIKKIDEIPKSYVENSVQMATTPKVQGGPPVIFQTNVFVPFDDNWMVLAEKTNRPKYVVRMKFNGSGDILNTSYCVVAAQN